MNLQSEKKRIIEEIENVQEEWLILAIKKLLDIQELPSHHKAILEERLTAYTSGQSKLQDWDTIKGQL